MEQETNQKIVKAGNIEFCNDSPIKYIAGPCIIESEEAYREEAVFLKKMFAELNTPFVLKASYDKANRTSYKGFRGIGREKSLKFLKALKEELGITLLTDVHEPSQAAEAAAAADILQIPAFLCRQTDLLYACADTGRTINVKKGQFLAPWEMENVIAKLENRGCKNIMITERGTSFGYGNLVVDMRGLQIMKQSGYPVIFDCTHSVQKPGALGTATGGDRRFVLPLAKAAAALKIAGIFFETHPNPEKALSDGPNSLRLSDAKEFVQTINKIDGLAATLTGELP